MEKKKWFLLLGAALIVVVAGLGIIFFASNKVGDKNNKVATENGQVSGASTQDDAYKVALAKELTAKGMVMYGAYWCPHCNEQKELFGDAVKYIDYVECDAKGANANPDECVAKGVSGYPTWIYQDQKHEGKQSLDQLAKIVGFKTQ